jgi:hypothetical protein
VTPHTTLLPKNCIKIIKIKKKHTYSRVSN